MRRDILQPLGRAARLGVLALAAATLGAPETPRASEAMEIRKIETPDGRARRYHLHAPAKAAPGPLPLVIVLHGGGGDAPGAAEMTGFNALADREGFLVVYPEGTGNLGLLTWNAGSCCAYAMRERIDDVGFIAAMIERLIDEGAADPERVYATGMSNGAMMTHRLGRELSTKIAAIAPVVGAVFGGERPPAGPVSALIINGARDEAVPPNGGWSRRRGLARRRVADAPYAPAAAQLSYWASADRCGGAPLTEEKRGPGDGAYNRYAYTGCAGGAEVIAYLLLENGHAWPGGRKGSALGDAPVRDFDASAVIWRFFEDKRKAF